MSELTREQIEAWRDGVTSGGMFGRVPTGTNVVSLCTAALDAEATIARLTKERDEHKLARQVRRAVGAGDHATVARLLDEVRNDEKAEAERDARPEISAEDASCLFGWLAVEIAEIEEPTPPWLIRCRDALAKTGTDERERFAAQREEWRARSIQMEERAEKAEAERDARPEISAEDASCLFGWLAVEIAEIEEPTPPWLIRCRDALAKTGAR